MNFPEIVNILIFGYPVSQEFLDPAFPLFLQSSGGLILSLIITLVCIGVGSGGGIGFAILRHLQYTITKKSPFYGLGYIISKITGLFTETILAIPILVLVLVCFYLPYPLFGLRIPAIILGIFAFSLYASVYICEEIRSGFNAIPPDLIHTARVLGISPLVIFLKVRLPIVVRVTIPSFLGVCITVFKDSSVLMAVGVGEITFVSRQISVSNPSNYALILFLVIGIYWSIAYLLSFVARILEANLKIKSV